VDRVRSNTYTALECLRCLKLASQRFASVVSEHERVEHDHFTHQKAGSNDIYILTAACRLSVGALAERVAALYASYYMATSQVSGNLPVIFSRLSHDSYAAALWTSVHADYIVQTNELLSQMHEQQLTDYVSMPPIPSSLSWAVTSLPDLLYVVNQHVSSRPVLSTTVEGIMKMVFNRCTASSMRGWSSAMDAVCKGPQSVQNICALACVAALTGMNAAVHPAARPTWEQRMRIQKIISCSAQESTKMISMCGMASREAIRLYLATMLARAPCTRETMFVTGNMAGSLIISPFENPSTSLQSCAATFASVGIVYLQDTLTSTPNRTETIQRILNTVFADDVTKRGNRHPMILVPSLNSLAAKKSSPNWRPPHPTVAVDAVSKLTFDVFSAQFIPYWNMQQEQNIRTSTLTPELYDFLHTKNPMHTLFDMMPVERQMFVQRVALADNLASHHTVAEVVDQLGHNHVKLTETHPLHFLPATVAAEVVLYARVAAIKKLIVVWDIGAESRALQVRALAKRTGTQVFPGDDIDTVVQRIPKTARHLYLCISCRRVCNSTINPHVGAVSHTEVGICQTMLHTPSDLVDSTLRCGKKSIIPPKLDRLNTNRDTVNETAKENKRRRDRRNCFNSVDGDNTCGSADLCEVDILGRMVSVFGQHVVLCCFCGMLVTLMPDNRFMNQPCCMHCDGQLVRHIDDPPLEEKHYHCRFCGKRDPLPTTRSTWKSYYAPQDNMGANQHVPPPLRRVVYCNSHAKPWLNTAHRSCMTMNEIIAHISLRIKPVVGASIKDRQIASDSRISTPRKRFKLVHKRKANRILVK
jgi:hypothetical protein